MKKFYNHPYHLVTISPWPLLTSLSMMNLMINIIQLFHYNYFSIMGLISVILCSLQWWRDVIRESCFQGMHTMLVVNGLHLGMILFIISEVFFFFSFFWSYFHCFLSPGVDIGDLWPPMNIISFNPYDIPLSNTIILLSSGVFITCSHFSIIMNDVKSSLFSLFLTLLLGLMFSFGQYIEYVDSTFMMSDSVYGSLFFLITGFHGLHVMIGIIFLLVMYIRMYLNHFSMNHFFGFEASSWYWHFVDVVWIFVYLFLYWWSY